MKRLIDWFRKPAIMEKLFSTGGEWDGDLVTYKHHKYYVNAQTGVVIRIEQCMYYVRYILQSFDFIRSWRTYCILCDTCGKIY